MFMFLFMFILPFMLPLVVVTPAVLVLPLLFVTTPTLDGAVLPFMLAFIGTLVFMPGAPTLLMALPVALLTLPAALLTLLVLRLALLVLVESQPMAESESAAANAAAVNLVVVFIIFRGYLSCAMLSQNIEQ